MSIGTPIGVPVLLALGLALGSAAPAAAALELPPDYQVLAPVQSITAADRALMRKRTAAAWRNAGLGDRKGLAVDAFASSAEPEVGREAEQSFMPASTVKLLTAAAVLKALGPQARFTTSVTAEGSEVYLVGGGDPNLSSAPAQPGITADASLVQLARRTADALADRSLTRIRLTYDDQLFAPPDEQPYWRKDFLRIGVVAPITALMVDRGRLSPMASQRSPDPSRTAAEAFARLLAQRGITVSGAPQPGRARGDQIASVSSPPLADLVERMLLVSDNTAAEVLAHHAGLELLGDPTFAGGAKATRRVLQGLGVDTSGLVLEDGSGLSRNNRITPVQLLAVLRAAIETDPDDLWPMYTGLPVAGFDGSLAARFRTGASAPGRGVASGKTGTLTGTSTLAGLVVDRDGQLFTYAVMTNGVDAFEAAPAIDTVVARIAQCRCAGAQLTTP